MWVGPLLAKLAAATVAADVAFMDLATQAQLNPRFPFCLHKQTQLLDLESLGRPGPTKGFSAYRHSSVKVMESCMWAGWGLGADGPGRPPCHTTRAPTAERLLCPSPTPHPHPF